MIMLVAQLAGAVALLLWSVRLIRTGVERAFMTGVRQGLRNISRRRVTAAAGGALAAMAMQSSAAVALIAGGFAASGVIQPAAALALLLGADLGSALMVQMLVLPVAAIIPFALCVGVFAFFRARNRKTKQLGRILIGFALILISIGMIRTATAPIAENEIVLAAAGYFESDLLSAYVIGAILALAMQSSLAAVLTFATFAATGVVTVPVAAALVFGANLGGAVVPVLLLWSQERPARLMALGNLLTRGGITIIALVLLITGVLPSELPGVSAAQQVVMVHLALNAALLAVALPLTDWPIALADKLLAQLPADADDTVSALDEGALNTPHLALACAQRELLLMGETVQAMLVPVMRLFRQWDEEIAQAIERRETLVDRMHFEIKIYLSRLHAADMPRTSQRKAIELVAMANSLEDAADRIAVNLVMLARKMRDKGLSFSDQGLADVEQFHDQVVMNARLAMNVLTTGDAEAARQLVSEKDRIRREEQRLQARHLERLQDNATASIETTNIHQETLRLLKQVNASLTYVAYPIAEETGDLLGSRLAEPQLAGGDG